MILTTGNLGQLAQVLFYNLGHCIVVGVAGLAVGEECLGVLGSTTGDGTLWRHSTVAEALDVLFLHQRANILLVEHLNLVILMRGAETVEEVYERNAGLERCKVGSSGHVHNFLYTALAKHGESSLAACHHVLVVAKDTQRVGSQSSGGNVEHTGNQLTGNLVHIGNHEQQPLRSGEGGGQRTCLQRTVNGTGRAGLRLHLLHTYGLSPQVLPAAGSPLVNVLSHRRARSDGVDSCYLAEHI